MIVLYAVVAALLGAAVLMSLVRLWRGPSVPDRAVAVDVLLAATVSGIAVYAAFSRSNTMLPILVVVGLLGFIGSVSVARLASRRDRDEQ